MAYPGTNLYDEDFEKLKKSILEIKQAPIYCWEGKLAEIGQLADNLHIEELSAAVIEFAENVNTYAINVAENCDEIYDYIQCCQTANIAAVYAAPDLDGGDPFAN